MTEVLGPVLALIAQVVTFLVALIGTFFKCVKEDARGKPLHSARGLPILTTPGTYILTLLVASFVSSLWLTRNSSRDMSDLQKELAAAGQEITSLSLQLKSANEEIKSRQEAAQADSARRLNDVTQKLAGASDLLERRVREVSAVRDFELVLFFYDMSRPAHIPAKLASSERDAGGLPDDSPGILRDMLCGARVQFGAQVEFDITISPNPALTFHAVCYEDVDSEMLVGTPTYEPTRFPIRMTFERWDQSAKGVYVGFRVDAKDLTDYVGAIGGGLTLNSFALGHNAWAVFSAIGARPKDFKRAEPFLPRRVGFSVAPNGGSYDPKSTWIYGPPECAGFIPKLAVVYRHGAQGHLRPEWSASSLPSIPTDYYPELIMNLRSKQHHFPVDLTMPPTQKPGQ
jgi:hypothetical protein